MSENLKSGDCVELKHGGGNIKMTLDHIFTYMGKDRAICKFYNEKEGKFEELAVNVEALKKSEGAN